MATRGNVNNELSYLLPVGISKLGTPVLDNVVFPEGAWEDLDGNLQEFPRLKIDNARLTVTRAKRIVQSTVNGRDGTIKEYINSMDFAIKLNGSLDGNPFASSPTDLGLFPFTELDALSKIERVPQKITILSKFLNSIFNVDEVVITAFSANNGGDVNTIDISINMVSDFDIDLTQFR